MRNFSAVAASAVFSVLVCPSLAQVPNGAAAPNLNQDIPKTIFQIGDDNTAVHLQSRLECPARIGDFRRTRLNLYEPFGTDVSCNYQDLEHQDITLYISLRPGEDLAGSFEGAKAAILQRSPNVTALAAADQQSFPSDIDWQHFVYAMSAAVHTGVWMTHVGNWNVEFRATYNARTTDVAFDAMTALTGGMEKTAGAHIAACAKLANVERNGHRLTGDDTAMMALTLSASIGGLAALQDPKTEPEPNWCIAQTATIDGGRFILWRNAGPGPTDRITALASTEAPAIFSVPDPLGAAAYKKDHAAADIYDIVIDGANAAQLVGIYDGLPPINDIARFAAKGPFALLSSRDKSTKKITIYRAPPPDPAAAK